MRDPVAEAARAEMERLRAAGRPMEALQICAAQFGHRPDYRDEAGHSVFFKEALRLALAANDAALATRAVEAWRTELLPGDPEVHVLHARHHAEVGNREAAQNEWQAVLVMVPDHTEARAWLEREASELAHAEHSTALSEDATQTYGESTSGHHAPEAQDLGEYGGALETAFTPILELHTLGSCTQDQKLLVFGRMEPPPQQPLLNAQELQGEVVAIHAVQQPIQDVTVYSLAGCRLTGLGLIERGTRFFFQDDVFPLAWATPLRQRPHGAAPWQAGAVAHPGYRITQVAEPVATVLHPLLVWGHFLMEMLPRLYLLDLLARMGKPFPLAVPSGLPSWMESIAALYVPRERWVHYDRDAEILEAPAIVAPGMMNAHYSMHPAFNAVVAETVARVGPDGADAPARPSRIFLSRRDYGSYCSNEAEAEAVFNDLGFISIRPEKLPFAEQVRMFQSAEVIAGTYGSGLHGALFARPGTRVIALNCSNHVQSQIARLRRHRLALVPPSDGRWRADRLLGADRNFTVDPAAVRNVVLRTLGSLTNGAGD